MTARRSEWGPPIGILARHRPDGLSKTMAISVVFHFLCFALVILSQVLSKLNKPNYQSFQVNLVASGVGSASSGRVAQKPARRSSKNTPPRRRKTLTPGKPPSASKKAVPALPAKSQKVKDRVLPSKVPTALPPPLPAPREKDPIKSPVAVQDDPDRLEEWWKKQSKSMKVPTVKTSKKQGKVVAPRRRTAKIDIMRKSVVVPPIARSSKVRPKKSDPISTTPVSPIRSARPEADVEALETKTLPQETSTPSTPVTPSSSVPTNEGEQSSPPGAGGEGSGQGEPTETASLGSTDIDGPTGSTEGASTGSTNFAFPGYLQRIDNKIRWQWAPPPITPEEDSLVVRFDIKKDGSIDKMSVVVEESSGNPFFDQAALRAVYAAHPFPPLPEAYSDQILTVYMHFIVQEAS